MTAEASARSQKRLAIFLDGTWNSVGDNTNVWRLKSLCSAQSDDGAQQLVYYDVGVNGFWGGVFGKGVVRNVADAYCWLVDNYSPGDEIFIFGFSRGAYTARSLAGLVMRYGLLKPGSPLGVKQILGRYRASNTTLWKMIDDPESGVEQTHSLEDRWLMKYSMRVPIKLVGVWDTVGSLGVPAFNVAGISRSTFKWLDTGLRLSLQNAFHALSIDDHRKSFGPTLWTKRIPKDPTAPIAEPRPLSSVEQRWFAGAHGNVGGGYHNDLLAQIPLKWIMNKARLHGLSFRYDIDIDGDVHRSPVSNSYKEFLKGAYSLISWRHHRPIGAEPIDLTDGAHETVNETVDASVFQRWRTDASYRPPSLREWERRRGANIETIQSAVRADQPSVAVAL